MIILPFRVSSGSDAVSNYPVIFRFVATIFSYDVRLPGSGDCAPLPEKDILKDSIQRPGELPEEREESLALQVRLRQDGETGLLKHLIRCVLRAFFGHVGVADA